MCQAVYIFIYLTTQFPHLPFSPPVTFSDLTIFLKLPIAFWRFHEPQHTFYVRFELLCFGCNHKGKEEVCTWPLTDLTFLLLTCFACQFCLRSPTSLLICYPICHLYTSLSVLLLPRLLFCGWTSLHFLPHVLTCSFQVYFLSLYCPQSTCLSTYFFCSCTFHITAWFSIICKFVSYLGTPLWSSASVWMKTKLFDSL